MPEKDRHLVDRTLAGNRHAFGDLVERYSGLVHGLALEITRRPDAVEDLVQETFCKAYEQLATLRKPDRFSSWLYTIAANKSQEWLRQQQTRRRIEGAEESLPFGHISMTPEAELEKSEALETLWAALDQLPPEYRRVLILHFWEDCSYQSIGGFLGIGTTTVRWRTLRAQNRLKQNVLRVLREKAEGAAMSRRERKEKIMAALPTVPFFRQPPPPLGWTTWGWKIASFLGLIGAAGWFGMTIEAPGILERVTGEDSADTSASFHVRRKEMELPAMAVSWTPHRPRAGQTVRFEIAGTASPLGEKQAFLHYMKDPRYPVDHVIPLKKADDSWSAEWQVPADAATFFFHISEKPEPQEFDSWSASPARRMQYKRYTHVFSVHDGDRKPVQNAAAWQAEVAYNVGRPDAEILALWDQEIALHPDNFEARAHRWLAMARADTSEKTRMRTEVERQALWERYPDRPEAFWWSIVYEVGKRPELYRQMRERFPDYPHLDDLAARICGARKWAARSGGRREAEEAIRAYEELIQLYPQSAYVDDAYGGLLRLLEKEDPERALSLADSILSGALKWEQDPARERSQRFGGMMTLEGKAHIFRINRVLAKEVPLSPGGKTYQEANQLRARRHFGEEKFSRIRALIQELKDSSLQDFFPYYYLGEQLWGREDEEDRREIYAAAVDILEAGRVWAYPEHILTFPHFQRIPAYVPPSAHKQREQQNVDRAREESSQYLFLLAQKYFALDDVVKARECLEEAAALAAGFSGKWVEKLFMLLGEVRQQMGDREEAKAAYLQVLKLAPGPLPERKLAGLAREHPGEEENAQAALRAAYPEIPDISLTDAQGNTVDLREYRGRAVLIYHDGAVFSGLLSRRLEILEEWQRPYADRDLVLLYICGSDREYLRTREMDSERGTSFAIFRDEGNVWSGFGLQGMSLLLIDRKGRLRLKEGGWIEAMKVENLGRIAGNIEMVVGEAWPDEEGEKIETLPLQHQVIPERNSPPSAWLHTEMLRANRVRFYLDGTRDREDGVDLQGTIGFGDQTDTTFTRVPSYIDHQYADEGTYTILLRVEDSGGLQASVSLELVLKLILRMPRPDIEYERGYKSKPLDR